MKKVYLVTQGDYSAYSIVAIFTTRRLAERYILACSKAAWQAAVDEDRLKYKVGPWPKRDNLSFGKYMLVLSRIKNLYLEYNDIEPYDLWDVVPVVIP